MQKPIVQQFIDNTIDACRWVQRNALTISGVAGCAAGGFVIWAGSSSAGGPSLKEKTLGLIIAGVLEWTSFGTNAIWGRNDKDKGDDAKAQFTLTKALRPWKYPAEVLHASTRRVRAWLCRWGIGLALHAFTGNASASCKSSRL